MSKTKKQKRKNMLTVVEKLRECVSVADAEANKLREELIKALDYSVSMRECLTAAISVLETMPEEKAK